MLYSNESTYLFSCDRQPYERERPICHALAIASQSKLEKKYDTLILSLTKKYSSAYFRIYALQFIRTFAEYESQKKREVG